MSPAGPASALAARLRAAAAILTPSATADGNDAGDLLERLTRAVQSDLTAQRTWLLLTAISAAYPTGDAVREATRAAELLDAGEAAVWLLDACLAEASLGGASDRPIEIVVGRAVVDVDFSARHDVHTGIQRVVRSTMPHWAAEQDIVVAAWTPAHAALRTLSTDETARVLQWAEWRSGVQEVTGGAGRVADDEWTLIVPWDCVVVVPEVPHRAVCDRLAGLAELSGNRVVAIGYDCIPVVSADLVPANEPNRFVKYLTAVKFMRRVAGISVSATTEFAGFAQMLATQGLPGPDVIECALPSQTPDALPALTPADRPLVLCIGSFEPRKNQFALLYAAEKLWREGIDFEVRFIGGGGVGRDFPKRVRRLAGRGYRVSISTAITDAELDAAYAAARFTVFTSTHEGYGLPVAESLSHGTPVITTDYGSTREIAAGGGAVLVDPRDDEALVAAMRTLLADDSRIGVLRSEIADRPSRGWDDYARELWDCLVLPELPAGRR
jgi:glycosyltransferase involved in cell wall biosynthesis